MDALAPLVPTTRSVSRTALFLGCAKIGMLGFGGIAPWARRVIVEERGWLDDTEYAALLGVGQVLPGPNTMNAAVMIGDRYQGAMGSVLCLAGLMAAPLLILVALASLYTAFASIPAVAAAVAGMAASAAGLLIGTGIKMLLNVRASWVAWPFTAAVFVAIALLHLSLVLVVLALAPLSILVAAKAHSS